MVDSIQSKTFCCDFINCIMVSESMMKSCREISANTFIFLIYFYDHENEEANIRNECTRNNRGRKRLYEQRVCSVGTLYRQSDIVVDVDDAVRFFFLFGNQNAYCSLINLIRISLFPFRTNVKCFNRNESPIKNSSHDSEWTFFSIIFYFWDDDRNENYKKPNRIRSNWTELRNRWPFCV